MRGGHVIGACKENYLHEAYFLFDVIFTFPYINNWWNKHGFTVYTYTNFSTIAFYVKFKKEICRIPDTQCHLVFLTRQQDWVILYFFTFLKHPNFETYNFKPYIQKFDPTGNQTRKLSTAVACNATEAVILHLCLEELDLTYSKYRAHTTTRQVSTADLCNCFIM